MRDVVVTGVPRAERVGLGHAVADVGPTTGKGIVDPLDELDRCRCSPAADGGERRGVVLGEGRALEQVPALGRDADERGDPFGLDQAQGDLRIPAVHHHQLHLQAEAREHDGNAAGDVEERHDQDERGSCARPVGGDPVPALARRVDGRAGPEGHQGLRHGPVGRDRTLGKPVVPDVYRMVASSSGSTTTAGIGSPKRDDVLVALDAVRKRLSGGHATAMTGTRRWAAGRCARSTRSPSTTSSTLPESSRA